MHVQSTSFIVRVHQDVDGRLSGVVERVRDGACERRCRRTSRDSAS